MNQPFILCPQIYTAKGISKYLHNVRGWYSKWGRLDHVDFFLMFQAFKSFYLILMSFWIQNFKHLQK